MSSVAHHVDTGVYFADESVISAGCIVLDPDKKKVCLIERHATGTYGIAKGRVDAGESIPHAATREAREETGVACIIVPLDLPSRATKPGDPANVGNIIQTHSGSRDFFCFQLLGRRFQGQEAVKIIFYYVAVVDNTKESEAGEAEAYTTVFKPYQEAIDLLEAEADKRMVRRAIDLFESTYPHGFAADQSPEARHHQATIDPSLSEGVLLSQMN